MLDGDCENLEGESASTNDGGEFALPTAAPDELVAVLETSLLEAMLDVFDPLETNVQLSAKGDVGIRLKTRTPRGYYLEAHVGTNRLAEFRPDTANRPVALGALERALDRTTADRVAVYGDADGETELRDGDERHDLTASETPLGCDHTAIMAVDKAANELDFALEAGTIRSLTDSELSRERLRVTADTAEETAEFAPVGADGTDSLLEVEPDEFVRPPRVNLGLGESAAERRFGRGPFDAAVTPMRGPVTVGLPSGSDTRVNFQYTRADGGVTVWAKLGTEQLAQA